MSQQLTLNSSSFDDDCNNWQDDGIDENVVASTEKEYPQPITITKSITLPPPLLPISVPAPKSSSSPATNNTLTTTSLTFQSVTSVNKSKVSSSKSNNEPKLSDLFEVNKTFMNMTTCNIHKVIKHFANNNKFTGPILSVEDEFLNISNPTNSAKFPEKSSIIVFFYNNEKERAEHSKKLVTSCMMPEQQQKVVYEEKSIVQYIPTLVEKICNGTEFIQNSRIVDASWDPAQPLISTITYKNRKITCTPTSSMSFIIVDNLQFLVKLCIKTDVPKFDFEAQISQTSTPKKVCQIIDTTPDVSQFLQKVFPNNLKFFPMELFPDTEALFSSLSAPSETGKSAMRKSIVNKEIETLFSTKTAIAVQASTSPQENNNNNAKPKAVDNDLKFPLIPTKTTKTSQTSGYIEIVMKSSSGSTVSAPVHFYQNIGKENKLNGKSKAAIQFSKIHPVSFTSTLNFKIRENKTQNNINYELTFASKSLKTISTTQVSKKVLKNGPTKLNIEIQYKKSSKKSTSHNFFKLPNNALARLKQTCMDLNDESTELHDQLYSQLKIGQTFEFHLFWIPSKDYVSSQLNSAFFAAEMEKKQKTVNWLTRIPETTSTTKAKSALKCFNFAWFTPICYSPQITKFWNEGHDTEYQNDSIISKFTTDNLDENLQELKQLIVGSKTALVKLGHAFPTQLYTPSICLSGSKGSRSSASKTDKSEVSENKGEDDEPEEEEETYTTDIEDDTAPVFDSDVEDEDVIDHQYVSKKLPPKEPKESKEKTKPVPKVVPKKAEKVVKPPKKPEKVMPKRKATKRGKLPKSKEIIEDSDAELRESEPEQDQESDAEESTKKPKKRKNAEKSKKTVKKTTTKRKVQESDVESSGEINEEDIETSSEPEPQKKTPKITPIVKPPSKTAPKDVVASKTTESTNKKLSKIADNSKKALEKTRKEKPASPEESTLFDDESVTMQSSPESDARPTEKNAYRDPFVI